MALRGSMEKGKSGDGGKNENAITRRFFGGGPSGRKVGEKRGKKGTRGSEGRKVRKRGRTTELELSSRLQYISSVKEKMGGSVC